MQLSNNINVEALRTANRAALKLRAIKTARDEGASQRLAEDVVLQVLMLIDRVDPLEFHQQYLEQQNTFRKACLATPSTINARWPEIHTQQSELLRANGIQEKLIAELGTEMSQWNFESIDVERLCENMNQLACCCAENAARLTDNVIRRPKRASSLASAVCGVSLLMVYLHQNEFLNQDSDSNSAMASFAASLLCNNVKTLTALTA